MAGSANALAGAQDAFSHAFVPANAGEITIVATDVDGTLTNLDGRITTTTLRALEHLRTYPQAPTLLLLTGRPAAAVQGLLIYAGFPSGVIIAENGAVVVPTPGAAPTIVAPMKSLHGEALLDYFRERGLPMRTAEDNADRISDITFVPNSPERDHETMQNLASQVEAAIAAAPRSLKLPELRVQFSSVHVHVGSAAVDKGSTLGAVLDGQIPALPDTPIPVENLLCVGDGANDLAVFERFPERAVAVPGEGHALDPTLSAVARYATTGIADDGFLHIVEALFP